MDLGFVGGYDYRGELFKRTRFDILGAYDNDRRCVATYESNIGGHVERLDLSVDKIKDVPKADILIGGFPCQDFASCGPRLGLGSDRGRLYLTMIKYMECYKPKVVVGENVPGLANIQNGEVLNTIITDIDDSGYRVKVWKMYAPDYGIPQKRNRLFIVGVRKDLPGFPYKPRSRFSPVKYRSIHWAINDLEDVNDDSVPNQSQYFKASRAKRGNGQGDETSKADEPSYTVRANAKSRVQFHYALDRRLTVRECARLQTFPDTFVFPHSATTNIMQIGNAVPPVLGSAVAASIERYLNRLSKG